MSSGGVCFEKHQREPVYEYVLRYLRSRREASSAHLIANLGLSKASVKTALGELRRRGAIKTEWRVRRGKGQWLNRAIPVSPPTVTPAADLVERTGRPGGIVFQALELRGDCPLLWFPAPVHKFVEASHAK